MTSLRLRLHCLFKRKMYRQPNKSLNCTTLKDIVQYQNSITLINVILFQMYLFFVILNTFCISLPSQIKHTLWLQSEIFLAYFIDVTSRCITQTLCWGSFIVPGSPETLLLYGTLLPSQSHLHFRGLQRDKNQILFDTLIVPWGYKSDGFWLVKSIVVVRTGGKWQFKMFLKCSKG